MRLTQSLCRQHLGRMFKKHWIQQSKKVVLETGAEKEILARGIPIFNPKDIIEEKREFQKVEIVGYQQLPVPRDENHPLYQERVCHMYRDHNVLLEGLSQAKIITKTVEVPIGLPAHLNEREVSLKHTDELVKRCILSSHVYDSVQEKLPKLHDSTRPAWRFPRVLGIPDYRRNCLLTSKLIQLCESLIGGGKRRFVIRDGVVMLPVEKDMDLIQFELTADLLLMSSNPLSIPLPGESAKSIALPNITPIKYTITLEKEHFYESKNIYPVTGTKTLSAHTAIFHYNPTQVKNLFETPVTETQILGRMLMKTFAVAAGHARQRFGDSVKDLPDPITLQSVHTDGQFFNFAVLQLNTLDLDGNDGTKNLLWLSSKEPLFTSCTYREGKPILDGYNPEVFKTLFTLYSNGLMM